MMAIPLDREMIAKGTNTQHPSRLYMKKNEYISGTISLIIDFHANDS